MAEPGWYDDPQNSASIRWWDGVRWSEHTAPKPPQVPPVPAAPSATRIAPAVRIPASSERRAGQASGSPSAWAGVARRLRGLSRRNLVLLTASAAVVLVVGVNGLATAASSVGTGGSGAVSGAATTADTRTTPTPSASPKGPKVTYSTATETVAVPFTRRSQDDPARDAGTVTIVIPGADGTLTRTYRIKLSDGVEISRELSSEVVTLPPVEEVTALGTYVAPPPPAPVVAAPAPQGGGCDGNYADGCVPVDSDVDCAGGSGDGPSYFSGTARVVGSDVYDLDRDGNGIACQS